MTQISVLLIAHPQNRQSQGSSKMSNFKSKCGLFQRFSRSTHTELTPIKPVAADEPKNNDLKKKKHYNNQGSYWSDSLISTTTTRPILKSL